jgi:hypothetical protein
MNGLTDSGEAGHRFIQPEPARSLAKKSDANSIFPFLDAIRLEISIWLSRSVLLSQF